LQTGSNQAAAEAGGPEDVCAFAGDRRHSVPAARGGSGYASSPPPTSRSFGHGPKCQRRVSGAVPGEGGQAGRDHRGLVDRRVVTILEVAQQPSRRDARMPARILACDQDR
jgi:hypothetical protein